MKSFLAGRPVQSKATIPVPEQPVPSGLAQALGASGTRGSSRHGSPTIECVKQGDKVMRLIVTCSCGERIEIECLYPAGH